MKFKVGDIVKVKDHIKLNIYRETEDGLWIPRAMQRYYGKIYRIGGTNENNDYKLVPLKMPSKSMGVTHWTWDDCCVEKWGITFQ